MEKPTLVGDFSIPLLVLLSSNFSISLYNLPTLDSIFRSLVSFFSIVISIFGLKSLYKLLKGSCSLDYTRILEEQATDMLQKLSIDPQTKTRQVFDGTNKVDIGWNLVLLDLYCGGYDDSTNEWDDSSEF